MIIARSPPKYVFHTQAFPIPADPASILVGMTAGMVEICPCSRNDRIAGQLATWRNLAYLQAIVFACKIFRIDNF
ncbi:MAG: hypothetical protein KKA12_13170 [Alphaproteobacteria bacterium]|nr:hypothetical protein [Alphaproteobacteria bacterium]